MAGDDTATTPFNTPARIDVLDNDNGTGIHITATGTSPNGTPVLNNDGTVTFTPTQDFHGDTTFTYTITDAAGQTTTGTVTITVTAPVVTPTPVVTAPPATTQPGLAVTGSTIAVGAIVVAALTGVTGLVLLLIGRQRRSRKEES